MRQKVRQGRLRNGMRYYSFERSGVNVSGILARVGSIHDPVLANGIRQRGMAHFYEHLAGRQSAVHGDRALDLILERNQCGPEEGLNVRTDRYSTLYGHVGLAWKHEMMEIFDALAHCILDQLLDEPAVKSERAAVSQEYRLTGQDNLLDQVDVLMHQIMYDRNPVRNRIDCELDDIKRLTVDDFRSFGRQYYHPKNMAVIMLGPKFEEVQKIARKYFSKWEPPSEPARFEYDMSETMPDMSRMRSVEVERKGIHQYHVAIGFPTGPYVHEDNAALDVLAKLWAWRVRRTLREENYDDDKGTYRVLSTVDRSFAHGLMYLWFATSDADFAKYGEEVILKECDNLRADLPAKDEFEAMHTKVWRNHLELFNFDYSGLAEEIIGSVSNGDEDLEYLHGRRSQIRKVTRTKVCEAAQKYFTPNYARVLIRPA